MKHPAALAIAFFSGAILVAQGRVNAQFTLEIHDGLFAALVSCLVGMAIMVVVVLAVPARRRALLTVPTAIREGRIRWWFLLSGLAGSYFVASQAIGVPLLGIALFSIVLTAAQVTSSLGVDRIGLGPAGKAPVTGRRVIAALLGLSAVAVAALGRSSVEGAVPLAALLLVLGAGVAMAPQQALNARIAGATHSVSAATAINFTVASFGLLIAVLIAHRGIPVDLADGVPPWLLLGGPIGLIYVGMATLVVRVVGVLVFVLAAVSGQLAASLLVDIVLPVPGTVVTWGLVSALCLSLVAVAVGALRR